MSGPEPEVLVSGWRPGRAAKVAAGQADSADWADSFDAFYRREFPRLVALARAVSGSASATDLAQEAMLVVFRRWDEVSGLEQPNVWARRVCLNLSRSLVRRRVVEARAMLRLNARREDSGECDVADAEFWSVVHALPRRQAQAIALRYVYGLDVAAIAETLGCSEGSAKTHLSRGRAALASRLHEGDEEPS